MRNCLLTSFIAIPKVNSRTSYLGEFDDGGAVKTDGRGGGISISLQCLRPHTRVCSVSVHVCAVCAYAVSCAAFVLKRLRQRFVCVRAHVRGPVCVCGLYVRACVRCMWCMCALVRDVCLCVSCRLLGKCALTNLSE